MTIQGFTFHQFTSRVMLGLLMMAFAVVGPVTQVARVAADSPAGDCQGIATQPFIATGSFHAYAEHLGQCNSVKDRIVMKGFIYENGDRIVGQTATVTCNGASQCQSDGTYTESQAYPVFVGNTYTASTRLTVTQNGQTETKEYPQSAGTVCTG